MTDFNLGSLNNKVILNQFVTAVLELFARPPRTKRNCKLIVRPKMEKKMARKFIVIALNRLKVTLF